MVRATTIKNAWSKVMATIKKYLQTIMNPFKPLIEPVIELECAIAKYWVSGAHHRLMLIQWGLLPEPEHFDHQIGLYYQWLKTRNSLWLERGVFGSLALKGGNVLELACGDGFNAKNFYSLRSRHITACDFDPKAIKTAKKKNNALNIEFVLADIRNNMPEGKFENIIWDAAIEHFTPLETNQILLNIKTRLVIGGVLSGYTLIEKVDEKTLSHHEQVFKTKEDLMRLLKPHFNNITVFETIYPTRHNLYFWASDETIPFNNDWGNRISYNRGTTCGSH
jgi:SAM-dependent methyltransferase